LRGTAFEAEGEENEAQGLRQKVMGRGDVGYEIWDVGWIDVHKT
jgi:hypothetical protein